MTESEAPGSRFRRVLLKMSGEALLGDGEYGHDRRVLRQLADDVRRRARAWASSSAW